jgi:hypothetical protein
MGRRRKFFPLLTDKKFEKFLKCLDQLVVDLSSKQDLPVHTNINQFYYMQKIVELKVLKNTLEEELARLNFVQENLESVYRQVFISWSRDVRWLKRNEILTSKSEAPKNADTLLK